MNIVEKIKCFSELEMKKNKIERELAFINDSIEEQKNSCLHIVVNLGNYGLYPSTEDKYCCLICGKDKGEEHFNNSKHIVHAENYLLEYDIRDKEQFTVKFEHIQTLACGLLSGNNDMSREELVDQLNNLIQEVISIRQSENSSKLVKTKNLKK